MTDISLDNLSGSHIHNQVSVVNSNECIGALIYVAIGSGKSNEIG